MDIAIHNSKKKVSVSDDAFAASFNETLVHQVVTAYMAGARAGTRAGRARGRPGPDVAGVSGDRVSARVRSPGRPAAPALDGDRGPVPAPQVRFELP